MKNGDCANFVSQCIHAGDISFNQLWYMTKCDNYTYIIKKAANYISSVLTETFTDGAELVHIQGGWEWTLPWGRVEYQYAYLYELFKLRNPVVIHKNSLDKDIKDAIKSKRIRPGDILFFETAKGEPCHVAFIVGVTDKDIIYAGHTNHTTSGSVRKESKDYNIIEIIRLDDVKLCKQ